MLGRNWRTPTAQHHAFTATMTLGNTTNRYGARPVRTQQAGAAYGSLTRRSPTNATGDEQGKLLAERTSIQSKKNN